MEIQRVWAAYFSPTGTTEKIVTHIAEHLAKPVQRLERLAAEGLLDRLLPGGANVGEAHAIGRE